MELLVDTANLDDIKYACEYFPVSGVTCNPSIVKTSAKPEDFWAHARKMREIIGKERTLHIQVIALDSKTQIKEAEAIVKNVDKDVYIKVPVTLEGIKTISYLKKQGYNVTATGVYDTMQAFYACLAGADYIAIYYNRMLNFGSDPNQLIDEVQGKIEQEGLHTKLLAASFHSAAQLKDSYAHGCEAITAPLNMMKTTFNNENIKSCVQVFKTDWESMYGEGSTLLNV